MKCASPVEIDFLAATLFRECLEHGDFAMRYLMMLYADEKAGDTFTNEEMSRAMAIMGAYNDALKKAGAFVATAPLQRSYDARTIRTEGGAIDPETFQNRQGELIVRDGPYAETREQLGGFYIIDARDMDEAIAWAGKCPAAQWGSIEVRQIFEDFADLPTS
jgi:hypothetical protein